MLVVMPNMGTGLALGTTCLDGAILQDYPVIATACPALGTVIAVNVIDSNLLADTGGGAMNDDVEHVLHGSHLFHGA